MSPPHAKVPPRVPVCSAAPCSLLHMFSVEQEVRSSSWRWDIPWNCPQDDRGATAVTLKQQQRRRLEIAELSRLSARWHGVVELAQPRTRAWSGLQDAGPIECLYRNVLRIYDSRTKHHERFRKSSRYLPSGVWHLGMAFSIPTP